MKFSLNLLILVLSAGWVQADKPIDIQARKARQAWIWTPPEKQAPPTVQNPDWPKQDLDRFILKKLEASGLKPAPPASRTDFIRRVSFALSGLPPTVRQIHDFVQNKTPEAKEQLVDQFLASPSFGERWARHWMDLMRYAESRGHESDFIIANAYHYRDYLIRAFNADVPYNLFLTEHVAGDLIRPPRLHPGQGWNESVLGTGWVFLGEEVHSPVDIRQDECDRIDNKIDVLSKSFLGLTVACARCHDHKFDPITQKDYYAMSGFISSSSYRQVRFETMEHNRKIDAEYRKLKRETTSDLLKNWTTHLKPGVDELSEILPKVHTDPRWDKVLQAGLKNPFGIWHPLAKALKSSDVEGDVQSILGEWQRTLKKHDAGRVILDYSSVEKQPWLTDGPSFEFAPPGHVLLADPPAFPLQRIMPYGAARSNPFWNHLNLHKNNEKDAGSLNAVARSGRMIRTPSFTLASGKLHYLIRGNLQVYAAVDSHIMITGPLHKSLVKNFASKHPEKPNWVTHNLSEYTGHRVHLEFGPNGTHAVEILKVVERDSPPSNYPRFNTALSEILMQDKPNSVEDVAGCYEKLFKTALAKTTRRQMEPAWAQLADWLLQNTTLIQASNGQETTTIQDGYVEKRDDLKSRIKRTSRTAVSWFDGSGVEDALLDRGSHKQPVELVAKGLPVAFEGFQKIKASGSGRLALARQLTDPKNPLVARVLVNRVWHHLFGRGIVSTVDNFGYLGERPSHPELLDHLAWEFIHEDQWSTKKLIKRIVLSQTYGMSSRPTDAKAEALDPENVKLHRMHLRRLEGEAIRDAILLVSGRLDAKMFGPPVPVHLTEFVIGRGRPKKSGPVDGEGRRSIYTSVKRNFLPTMMLAFDTPTPFSAVGRRNKTNVPAQSLVLMNDKMIYEQSRFWASRILKENPNQAAEERLAGMYESALGKKPSPDELGLLLESRTELAKGHNLAPDDLQVWSDLCHTIFNLNDFIYIR